MKHKEKNNKKISFDKLMHDKNKRRKLKRHPNNSQNPGIRTKEETDNLIKLLNNLYG